MNKINKYKKSIKNDDNLEHVGLIQEEGLEPNMYVRFKEKQDGQVLRGEREILNFLKQRYKK